jgi:hypothetical protein
LTGACDRCLLFKKPSFVEDHFGKIKQRPAAFKTPSTTGVFNNPADTVS